MHESTDVDEILGAPEITAILERVVISPATGRFHPHPAEIFTSEGEWVSEGQTVGEIKNGGGSIPVVSAFTGWMMGMLALAGQPVEAGDQLFWIHP